METVTIFVFVAAVIVGATLGLVVTVVILRRRLFPPSVRSVVFEHELAQTPCLASQDRHDSSEPLHELVQPLRPVASGRSHPMVQLYVKPGRKTSELLLLDREGLLEYSRIDDQPREDDVYLGKILQPDPGGNGLFVDIGEAHEAFLATNGRVDSGYNPGDRILCQLTGQPRGHKGYKVHDSIVLDGYYLTLLKDNPEVIGLSNLYDHLDASDAGRLSATWKRSCANTGRGVVVRNGAGTGSRAAYEKDFGYLMGQMNKLERSLKDPCCIPPFRLIHKEVEQAALDAVLSAMDCTIVPLESVTVVGAWRSRFITELSNRRSRSGPEALKALKIKKKSFYDRHEVETPLDKMRKKLTGQSVKIPCRSGADLVVESTEALVAIDVNSGSSIRNSNEIESDYALRVNKEATDTLARALRMLNFSGIVVVDYINMDDIGRDSLREYIQECFEHHEPLLRKPAKVRLGNVSPVSGVLDLTRWRDGYSLWEESRLSSDT